MGRQPMETNKEGGGGKRKLRGLLSQKVSGACARLFAAPPTWTWGLEAGGGEGVVAGAETRRPESAGMNLELLGEEAMAAC
jgi:hypothetical protein